MQFIPYAGSDAIKVDAGSEPIIEAIRTIKVSGRPATFEIDGGCNAYRVGEISERPDHIIVVLDEDELDEEIGARLVF